MGLKILHSADWHLDAPFTAFSSAQQETLRMWQRRLPSLIADTCRREKCDLVLLAGDLFDSPKPRMETVDTVKDALRHCGVPVFIAPGNHDYCCPGSVWQEGGWPENVHIFTGNLESVAVPELDCRVYGAGYKSMDCPALLDGFHAQGQEHYQIALLHGDGVTGSSSAYCPVTAAQVRESGLDYVALGHIHQAGGYRIEKALCAWPGAPMGRGWDESGEKGLAIVTLGDKPGIRAVTLDTPRFHDLTVDLGMNKLEEFLPASATPSFYRVTLTGYVDLQLDALRKQYAHIPNLEFIDRTDPPMELWEGAGEDTLRGTFFQMLKNAEENAAPKEARIVRLAAEISRRLLDGKEVPLA